MAKTTKTKTGDKPFAYIKYEGKSVKEGFLDARKSGEALVGIDDLLRYFLTQEDPEIKAYEFEIPVRIRKGSWETIFQEDINGLLIKGLFTWAAANYAKEALGEMAKNDFKGKGFKPLFKKAFKGMLHVIKLAKHVGTLNKQKFEGLNFKDNNTLVKITNEKGEELWLPTEVLELYSNCPETVFNNLAKIIEEDRELTIGMVDKNLVIEEKITTTTKYIFAKEEETDEIILPELVDGEFVALDGHVTRGNEKSNTIGFLYEGHIITCFPEKGNIKQYKRHMFTNARLKGQVTRVDKDGNINEKRPRIRFTEIISIDKPKKDLFNQ